MINGKDNPVEWAMLSYELEELIEHLQELSCKVVPDSSVDENEFKVIIGHAYAHLNRIWNYRNFIGEVGKTQEQHDKYSQMPKDIEPIG